MKIRIKKSTGAFTGSDGRVIVPGVGSEVDVEKSLGKALVASGAAEEVKSRRAAKPQENTASPGPKERRA